jgi:hypothetical protein
MDRRFATPIVLVAIVSLACVQTAPPHFVQADRPDRGRGRGGSADTAAKRAVAILVEEAKQATADLKLAHDQPDFASRFSETIANDDLLAAITAPQHDEPFIDAYVRWQLTSFEIEWPQAMEDRAFAKLIDNAPRLIDNPRADPGVLATLRQAEAGGPMPPRTVEQAREYVEEVEHRAMLVEQLNRPALELFDWLAERLGETGERPRVWMLVRLAAFARAGWPVSNLKGDITRAFTDSVADKSFTPEGRRLVVLFASRLVGPERPHLESVVWFADGRISLNIGVVSISHDNIDQWRKRLNGIVE